MRISFSYGASVYCDNVTIDNVYAIIIDEESESLDLCGFQNFSVGWINNYSEIEEISIIEYNENCEFEITKEIPIIKNGKLVYKNV